MDQHKFKASLKYAQPPEGLSELAQALWYDAKGDWERAHHIAQENHTLLGSWLHAYLHRKEGDISNAGYWYRRADRELSSLNFEEEWQELVEAII